ncbi:hypothetical protein ABZP36_035942 [Zizania latifolia]
MQPQLNFRCFEVGEQSCPAWPFNSALPRPPPAPTRDAATPSVPYFCPRNVAVATQERPPFPLFYFQRCPDCRVRDDVHERQLPSCSSSSSASSSSSPAVVLPPPPPLLSHFDPWDNYLFRSSRTSFEDWPPPESPTSPRRPPSPPSPTVESPSDHRGGGGLPLVAPRETFAAQALATVTVSDDAAAACAVCTDALPVGAAACRLPCGHLYHSDCIVPWLALRSSCPVCRRSVSPPSPTVESPSDHRGGGGLPLAAPRETFAAQALATVTVSDDAAAACAVCTDALPVGAAACRLPCGHLYHSDCIVPWLGLRSSCPVCRRSVPMFPSPTSTTEEITFTRIQPSPPPLDIDPQLTATNRRRSLPGVRQIRMICRRILNYI